MSEESSLLGGTHWTLTLKKIRQHFKNTNQEHCQESLIIKLEFQQVFYVHLRHVVDDEPINSSWRVNSVAIQSIWDENATYSL